MPIKKGVNELKTECRLNKLMSNLYPDRHMICFLLSSKNFSADLSPQDSTLLSDIVEVGPLPTLKREDEETRYAFYILTRQGLRYECSSISKIQVLRAV